MYFAAYFVFYLISGFVCVLLYKEFVESSNVYNSNYYYVYRVLIFLFWLVWVIYMFGRVIFKR